MEKRKLSGKTILKIAGAILALVYFGLCLYAGLTGKNPSMQKVEHVRRFGDIKNWVSGGVSASIVFALCIHSALNDLEIWMWRKKSFFPFFLLAFTPGIAMLLLDAYQDIGWAGIAVYVGCFGVLVGIAWIPLILNRVIAHRLLRSGPASGRQLMRNIEWIHFYPLKKLLVFGLWSFGIVIILRVVWVTATGEIKLDGESFLITFVVLILVLVFFKKMKNYVCTPYYSMPVLNRILTKSQIECLMDGEQFERVQFQCIDMERYMDIYRSRNWMVVNGKLLSKKLALDVRVHSGKEKSRLEVTYLNGMVAKVKVELDLSHKEYREFGAVTLELEGHAENLALRGKEKQLAQKFETLFPECASEQERMYTFLLQDAEKIRNDYIQAFLPQSYVRKKKARYS